MIKNTITVIFSLFSFALTQTGLVINEFMAKNILAISDDFGDYDDWIEIYNTTNSAVDIAGYFLSDNFDFLTKWQFPLNDPRTLIPAKGYLLVWADDQEEQGIFHLPFKLSEDESIFLISSDAHTNIDSIKIENQENDISYGRYTDGEDNWGYIIQPTPGASNLINYKEFAPIPHINVPSGIYHYPINVHINSDSGQDTIYYSMDGSDPDRSSKIYDQSISLDSTSVLRTRIIKENYAPGKIVPAVYFINTNHNIPIISIITDPENLFSDSKGIYSNYLESGREWERKIHMTYFDEDESLFSLTAGLRLQGNSGREMDKKSFRLFFRNGYGNERLEFPLFNNKDISSFKNLVLRAGYDDDLMQTNGTLLRDPVITELWKRTGNIGSQSSFSVLYLNNDYWGIYDIREDINDHFIEDYYDLSSLDIIRLRWTSWELEEGNSDEWKDLIDFFNNNHFFSNSMYEEASNRIDIENYTDLQVLYHLTHYYSWVYGAYAFKENSPHSKWRFLIWDMDRAMNDMDWNGFQYYDNPMNQYWINIIIQRLLENNDYKAFFVNKLCNNINTIFAPENFISIIDSLVNIIEPEIGKETNRWAGTYAAWTQNKNYLRNFAHKRASIVLSQMKEYFQFSEPKELTVQVNNNGGLIKINDFEITKFPWLGSYFKEVPVKISAVPKDGYYFSSWSDPKFVNNPEIELTLEEDDTLIANFLKIDNNYLQVINPARSTSGRVWPVVVRSIDESGNSNFNLSEDLKVLLNSSMDSIDVISLKKGAGTYVMDIKDSTDFNFSLENNEITTYSKNITIRNGYPQELISGTLSSGNIVWTDDRDYFITDDLTIPSDCHLSISEGTQIILMEDVNIFVYGDLEILGNEYKPVIFIPENTDRFWGGIEFYNARANIEYCFFVGAGGDESKSWGHSSIQCILFAKEDSELNLNNCYILNSPGKAIGSLYSKVDVSNCITAFVFHGGEYLYTKLHYKNSHIMNIPNDDNIFEDSDSDGFHIDYLYPGYRGYSVVENCFLVTGKDDAVDHHAARLEVKNCYINGWMHEGVAASGGDTIKVFNTIIRNCEQGIEAGWTEADSVSGPNVFIDHCVVIDNDVGLRYGDSYSWEYRGHLTATNTILFNNDDNIRNFLNSTQAPKEGAIEVYYTMTNDEEYDDSPYCITGYPEFDQNYFLLPGSDGIGMGMGNTNLGLIDTSKKLAGSIIINEIMYNAAYDLNSEVWIELYNPQLNTQDMSNWIFQDENETHKFVFPTGFNINSQSFFILCRDSMAFQEIYPNINNFIGNFNFGLGSSDQVKIFSSNGILIDSVSYKNNTPWPYDCDGLGYSLALKNISNDNVDPQNWMASLQIGGTPGYDNNDSSSAITPDEPLPDKIHLYQNYPNPFNNQTKITFDLDEIAEITVSIYNILGQKIRDLYIKKTFDPGQHYFTFRANQLASGIYFYRINVQVNNKTKHFVSKKMLLIQ